MEQFFDSITNTTDSLTTNEWKTLYVDETKLNGDITIDFSHRGKKGKDFDTMLYSSIKYTLKNTLVGKFDSKVGSYIRLLIQVTNENGEEIIKFGDNKTLEISDSLLSFISNGGIEDKKIKIQFKDCSYHNGRKPFRFKVFYFLKDEMNPFLIKTSPCFMVYARKKDKKVEKETKTNKRKRSVLEEFETCLENLALTTNTLCDSQKTKAYTLLISRLKENFRD